MSILLFLLTFSISALCLHEDQVGKFDWSHQFIGPVTNVYLDVSSNYKRSLLVGSKSANVIASLNFNDGLLLWRRVLEEEAQLLDMIVCKDALFTFSSANSHLREWNPTSGQLIWEERLSSEKEITWAKMLCSSNHLQLFFDDGHVQVSLSTFQMESQPKRKILSQIAARPAQVLIDGDLVVGVLRDSIVWSKSSSSGVHQIQSLSWLNPEAYKQKQCVLTGTLFACLDTFGKRVHYVDLSKNNSVLSVFSKGDQVPVAIASSDKAKILVTLNDDTTVVYKLNGDVLERMFSINSVASPQTVQHKDKTFYLGIKRLTAGSEQHQIELYDVADGKVISEGLQLQLEPFQLDRHHGGIKEIHVEVFNTIEGQPALRMLLICRDEALIFLKPEVRWVREEALASVVGVEYSDLAVTDAQASIEQEFDQSGGVFMLFCKRIRVQLRQFHTFVQRLVYLVLKVLTGRDFLQAPTGAARNYQSELVMGVPEWRMGSTPTRDDFNLNKAIILITKVGKLFGLESATGKVIWCSLVGLDVTTFKQDTAYMFTQRTSAHFPLKPLMSLVLINSTTQMPFVYSFDPTNGKPIQVQTDSTSGSIPLPEQMLLATLHPVAVSSDSVQFVRPLMLLTASHKLLVYPNGAANGLMDNYPTTGPLFLCTAQRDRAFLEGFKVSTSRLLPIGQDSRSHFKFHYETKPVWSLGLNSMQDPQQIVALAGKLPNEHVHSMGRVLGDRSVLFKYLSPNLLALVTQSQPKGGMRETRLASQTNITLHLVDIVTGRLLHSALHTKCGMPVNLVMSENWVIYSFYNYKNYRTEVVVVELYEPKHRTDKITPWQIFLRAMMSSPKLKQHQQQQKHNSSMQIAESERKPLEATPAGSHLDDPFRFSSIQRNSAGLGDELAPWIQQRSFIVGLPMRHGAMTVSLTEKGITAKSLLVATASGSLIEVPKAALDPRRGLELPMEMMQEEGLEPYVPELGLPAQAFISYNITLARVRGVKTTPTGLESTSLLFAHGLDLFYSRVTPSKAYDLLKDDFDYFFISAVFLGMIVATLVCQRLAKWKAIARAWI